MLVIQIHPDATPIIIERNGEQKVVGWDVETRDFNFQAVQSIDGKIDSYVLWGDDQPGDVAQHSNWESVKQWLDALIQASRR